jgi:hypothetical protein
MESNLLDLVGSFNTRVCGSFLWKQAFCVIVTKGSLVALGMHAFFTSHLPSPIARSAWTHTRVWWEDGQAPVVGILRAALTLGGVSR